MNNTDKVHVFLLPTHGESRITSNNISNTYHITVFINPNNTFTQYKLLLPQFARCILGKQLLEFNVNDIPMYIENIFRFICRQLSNGVSLENLVDEQGVLLFSNSVRSAPVESPKSQSSEFQQAITAVLSAIDNNVENKNIMYRLLNNLGGSLINMAQSNVVRDVEPRFVENRQGATREIIVNENIAAPVNSINTQVNTLQLLREDTAHINLHLIRSLAASIKEAIAANKTKPPSFTKHSKANYRKIKNYVHHLTKIWLSKKEIEIFICEMNNTDVLNQLD